MVQLREKKLNGRRFLRFQLLMPVLVVCSLLRWYLEFTIVSQSFAVPLSAIEKQEVSSASASASALPHYYIPAPVEAYTLDHADDLGFNTVRNESSSACDMWKNKDLPIHQDLLQYVKELDDYTNRVEAFKDLQEDIRILKERDPHVCDTLKLHPDGLPGIFKSGQLSQTISNGYVEPLLPPLRHPKCCLEGPENWEGDYKLMTTYLVHDFQHMCRALKRHSRIVLVDMGASLEFHADNLSPTLSLYSLYHKFGLQFDHIYAYEKTRADPDRVFSLLPKQYLPAYHWINVGVNKTVGDYLNPFTTILQKFTPDDLIIVKLDIDTSWLELPLAQQLLNDEKLHNLVDHFYFEHHVFMKEIEHAWKSSMSGSVKESLKLFTGLRQQGVASHSWV
jgi:hypothetical protein